MRSIKRYSILWLLLTLVQVLSAQVLSPSTLSTCSTPPVADSLLFRVYFREGYRYVDAAYRNNRYTLDSLQRSISLAQKSGELQSIDVQAFTSPTGVSTFNKVLAERRTDSVASWILQHTPARASQMRTTSGGIGWELLCRMLADSDAPYRNEVINIVRNIPTWTFDDHGRINGGRKQTLMNLRGGSVWRDMSLRFFPDMRSSALVLVVTVPTSTPPPPQSIYADIIEEDSSTVCRKETLPLLEKDTVAALPVLPSIRPVVAPFIAETDTFLPRLALKTNLLFDLLAAPNVEVELPLGKRNRWSVMAECWFPWYVWHHNSRAYQILYIGAEARRWLGDRTRHPVLQGFFVGGFMGGGKYDLEWNSKGYQGEFYIAAGATCGYSKYLNRRLRLETGLGVGYLRTRYRRYHGKQNDKYLVWQRDGRYSWLGPTKLKVSLVWLWGKTQTKSIYKKGGVQ